MQSLIRTGHMPLAPKAASVGRLKVAREPTPLEAPGSPEPARVDTVQEEERSGCELPGDPQALKQVHSTGGAASPGQKNPLGQITPAGEVEAGTQAYPGAAVQFPLQAGVERPGEAPYVPVGHGRGSFGVALLQ